MNWRKIVGGLLLMIAGAALALGTEHMILLHHHRGGGANPTSSIIATLDDVLQLSAAQHDSLENILKRHQTEVDSAWRAIHRELGSSMDSVHKEVGRILTAEQNERFRSWLRSQHLHQLH